MQEIDSFSTQTHPRYFEKNGEPLFSSHMLDLSEESLEENIAICKKHMADFKKKFESEVLSQLEPVIGVNSAKKAGTWNA